MNYFQVLNNGSYTARVVCNKLNRQDAIEVGREISDIIRAAGSTVIVDFDRVEYTHKDCLMHIIAAAYENLTNGALPIRIANASPRLLSKFRTLVPQEDFIYRK